MDGSNNVVSYYIHGLGLIAKITPAGQRYIYHYDKTGNTIAITDSSENLVNQYAYTPFGINIGKTEAILNDFEYGGKFGIMQEDNNLLFMRARFYEPSNGKFLSKDPVRGKLNDPQSLHYYNYVANNPLLFADPSGLFWEEASAFLGAIGEGLYHTSSYIGHTTSGVVSLAVTIPAGGTLWLGGQLRGAIRGQDEFGDRVIAAGEGIMGYSTNQFAQAQDDLANISHQSIRQWAVQAEAGYDSAWDRVSAPGAQEYAEGLIKGWEKLYSTVGTLHSIYKLDKASAGFNQAGSESYRANNAVDWYASELVRQHHVNEFTSTSLNLIIKNLAKFPERMPTCRK